MTLYNIKRKWKLLSSLLFITISICLLQISITYMRKEADIYNQTQISKQDILQTNKKGAFVTFLCDDIMGEATEVLVHSLKKTNTKYDIVVLVLDDVTPITRNKLEYLGAKIISVDQIKYSWNSSSARRKGFNKACRYSKLNLWNLIQYEKVVFLDADTMVVNPIDELFDYPQFSAVVDIGGVLNTGVFVAEPNVETYRDIMRSYEKAPSYNKGDQGFLNYYFNQSINPLPGNYNLMVKFTHFSALAASFVTKNTVKVLHFTSETKPWNFHFLHQREWKENYNGYLFGLWARTLRQTQSQLAEGGLLESAENIQDSNWENEGRVEEICDHRLRKNYGNRYPKSEQFTVILNLNELPITKVYLEQLLSIYASSKKVAQIFIHSNVIKDEQGKNIVLKQSYFRNLHLPKSVKVVPRVTFNSVNNIFNPIQGLVTTSVFLVEGNVFTSVKDLEFTHNVWKKNQDALVGFIPSSHSFKSKTHEPLFEPNLDTKSKRYSMVSSKAMFMKSDLLYAYTCLLPESIHQYIDKHPVCHDIVINMLASGMTGTSPVLVNASFVSEFQQDDNNSIKERSQCISDLTQFFNGENTLMFSDQLVTPVLNRDNILTEYK